MKSFKQFLLEMPQHYPGKIIYQKDTKFTPISVRNIEQYNVLHNDGEFIYLVDEQNTTGFVFDLHDFHKGNQKILPVMRVSLRNTDVKDYKQAYHLRIREKFAQKNITSTWYESYVNVFGGIVSDMEHLEGGKTLWKSFIKDPNKKTYLFDTYTKNSMDIPDDWSDQMIWSNNEDKKNIVIVYEK